MVILKNYLLSPVLNNISWELFEKKLLKYFNSFIWDILILVQNNLKLNIFNQKEGDIDESNYVKVVKIEGSCIVFIINGKEVIKQNYLQSIFELLKLIYKSYHSINNKVSYHNNMIYVNDTISRDIKEYKSHDSDHSNNFEEEIRTISSEPNSEDDYLEITKSNNFKKGGSFNKGKKERD